MSALDTLQPVFALLLDAGLKATVVLVGALAATRLMRRRAAAARHLVWSVALAAVLALPLLSLALPAWKALPLPAYLRFSSASEGTTIPAEHADVVEPAVTHPDGAGVPAVEHAASDASPSASTTGAERGPLPVDWRTALLAVWATGGILLIVRLAYGLARVAWIERRAVEITDDRWVGITDRLTRRLRIGRMVTLLRESHASVPMTWGVLRPVVLLPAEADAWDDERRTVVLAHELAHVRRWDPLTQWIAHLALAVFWFHPLVWRAARQMREERERACDDAVLALGTRPARYADHLLQIVRSLGQAEGPAAALAMARRSQFEGRLLAILDGATPRGGAGRGLGIAALAVAAVAVVPLAALRAAEPRPAAVADDRPSSDASPSALVLEDGGDEDGASIAPHRRVEARRGGSPRSASGEIDRKAETVARELGIDPSKANEIRNALRAGRREQDRWDDLVRAAETMSSPTERSRALLMVMEGAGVRPATLAAALNATQGITSEGARRQVLKAAAVRRGVDEPVVQRAFFSALASLPGEGSRRDVLAAALGQARLTDAFVRQAVDAARTLPGSGSRRSVIHAVLARAVLAPQVMSAVVTATRELPSSGDRATLLLAVLSRARVDGGLQRAVVDASREMPSSGDRKAVLKALVGRATVTEDALRRTVLAVREMSSCGDRREVLVTLLNRAYVPPAVLTDVFGAVREMTSSGDQRAVLEAAVDRTRTRAARDAYLEAARSVTSEGDRAAAVEALLESDPRRTEVRSL